MAGELLCTGESEETSILFNYIETWILELAIAYLV